MSNFLALFDDKTIHYCSNNIFKSMFQILLSQIKLKTLQKLIEEIFYFSKNNEKVKKLDFDDFQQIYFVILDQILIKLGSTIEKHEKIKFAKTPSFAQALRKKFYFLIFD